MLIHIVNISKFYDIPANFLQKHKKHQRPHRYAITANTIEKYRLRLLC